MPIELLNLDDKLNALKLDFLFRELTALSINEIAPDILINLEITICNLKQTPHRRDSFSVLCGIFLSLKDLPVRGITL
ncbi:hypothetical protein KJ966_19075 [bacterium]|nr:hypothetical protein [bacterium]